MFKPQQCTADVASVEDIIDNIVQSIPFTVSELWCYIKKKTHLNICHLLCAETGRDEDVFVGIVFQWDFRVIVDMTEQWSVESS